MSYPPFVPLTFGEKAVGAETRWINMAYVTEMKVCANPNFGTTELVRIGGDDESSFLVCWETPDQILELMASRR